MHAVQLHGIVPGNAVRLPLRLPQRREGDAGEPLPGEPKRSANVRQLLRARVPA